MHDSRVNADHRDCERDGDLKCIREMTGVIAMKMTTGRNGQGQHCAVMSGVNINDSGEARPAATIL